MITSLIVACFFTVANHELQLEKLFCLEILICFCAATTGTTRNSLSLLNLINVKCTSSHSCSKLF